MSKPKIKLRNKAMHYSKYLTRLSSVTGCTSTELFERGLVVSFDTYNQDPDGLRKFKADLSNKKFCGKAKALELPLSERLKALAVMSDLIPVMKAVANEKQLQEEKIARNLKQEEMELNELLEIEARGEVGAWA